jgi:hypothetical protein
VRLSTLRCRHRLLLRTPPGRYALEHNDWDGSMGLPFIGSQIRGMRFHDLKESIPLLAFGDSRHRLISVTSQFDSYRRIRSQVVKPGWMLGRSSLRCDDEYPTTVHSEAQWNRRASAGASSGRRHQENRKTEACHYAIVCPKFVENVSVAIHELFVSRHYLHLLREPH